MDARFVLPRPVSSAVVLGGLGGWEEGLLEAGVALGGASPDLVVAPAARAAEAVARGAPAVVLEGRGARRALRAAYPAVRRYLPVPGVEAPELLVPLEQSAPSVYALDGWTVSRPLRRRLRNSLARALLKRRALPELRPVLAVGLAADEPPALVSAAAAFGVPREAEWFLTLGRGDALTRAVFHLFPTGAARPEWALKFARVRGYAEPFDRDERGLMLARDAGGVVAEHAPELLGRFEADGVHASVETAAAGRRLTFLLQGTARRSQKVRSIEAIAGWLVEAGVETRAPPEQLAAERARLEAEVLPRWAEFGVPTSLVRDVPPVPAVLQHNDPGSWNIVTDGAHFVAVDWESARRHGFPLWDLLYFLTDALVHLDGASAPERRGPYLARLLRGEEDSSTLLFSWVARAAAAHDVPAAAVGPIVTLGWLHHGVSHLPREATAQRLAPGAGAGLVQSLQTAELWLTDPALGRGWSAWRR